MVETLVSLVKYLLKSLSFYVYKIYLKSKRDFDQTNTILEILEHCIEYDPSEQERSQDNM